MGNNFWKDKSVLITGCYGFLASSLAKKLQEKGCTIVGATRDATPESLLSIEGLDQELILEYGSITDYGFMERVLNEHEIQICFHTAAQELLETTTHSPLAAFETNIQGTWVVLEAARKCKTIQGVIVASSDRVYGTQNDLPYREEQNLLGRFPYDVSKSCADMIAQSYFHAFNLPVAIARCANIYGPGDFHWSRIIPGTIKSLLFDEQPVIRSDGSPVRDYLYIDDTLSAYMLLAENIDKKGVRGEPFNFAGQSPSSVIGLVDLIITLLNKNEIKPKILGMKIPADGIDRQFLSCEKANRILNWRAQFALQEGLENTIRWYRNYFNR